MPDILIEEIPGNKGKLGLITLSRQQALNALNHDMFCALDQQLITWSSASTIKAIVIRAAEGRAFCAGGDIRYAYEKKLMNDPTLINFFRDEYCLNRRIFHFPKPYIALLNGITMGGGAGISLHGSHCVATENLSFAMPETGIGFYPDIGASYFLSRLPHKIGLYLGLTGTRITYADCFALHLVNHVIAAPSQDKLLQALIDSPIPDKRAVTKIIQLFTLTPPPAILLEHQKKIATHFAKTSVEEIILSLEQSNNDWCNKTAKTLKTKSPTSLKVTLRQLTQGKTLDFDACMQMEFRLTSRFIQEHDFYEGIRAVVIDKDHSPYWLPPNLEDVTTQAIEKYFAPVVEELV